MCFKTKYHVLLQGDALRYVVAAALGHDFSQGDLTVMTFAGLSKKNSGRERRAAAPPLSLPARVPDRRAQLQNALRRGGYHRKKGRYVLFRRGQNALRRSACAPVRGGRPCETGALQEHCALFLRRARRGGLRAVRRRLRPQRKARIFRKRVSLKGAPPRAPFAVFCGAFCRASALSVQFYHVFRPNL